MSKIQAIRLINVNYNHNSIRISDECFELGGESTLLSLRNGGGKSVLVQMLLAPFVHKRYRDMKDRVFADYFTSAKPSFILVEWALDDGAGYVTAGLMIRRSQETGGETDEELEITSLISEYQEPCIQDLRHLPVVEKRKKEVALLGFGACRQLFESYKQDRGMKFYYYDMNQPAQSRQYFDRLLEYRIHYKEWENIIKRINLKESGLSELFLDCKDEKGLVEKWFLYAIENKLNKEKSRVKEFQELVGKYAGLYKDNRSKIKRRDTIRLFEEEARTVRAGALAYQKAGEEVSSQENRIACFIREMERQRKRFEDADEGIERELQGVRDEMMRVQYEKLSRRIHELEDKKRFHMGNRDMYGIEREALEREAARITRRLHLLSCAGQQETVEEERRERDFAASRLELCARRNADLEPERMSLGRSLRRYYRQEWDRAESLLTQNRDKRKENAERTGSEQERLSRLMEKALEAASGQGALESRVESFDASEQEFNGRYGESLARNMLGEYPPGLLEIRRGEYEKELQASARERADLKKKLDASRELVRKLERDLEDRKEEQLRLTAALSEQERRKAQYEEELSARRVIMKYLDLEEKHLFDREGILKASERRLLEIETLWRGLEREKDGLETELKRLISGECPELSQEMKQAFADAGIHLVYGMEWLKKNGRGESKNRELIQNNPFLPYALIMTRQEIAGLKTGLGGMFTSFPIPIIERGQLEQPGREGQGPLIPCQSVSFYVLFNEGLLNEEEVERLTEEKERQIRKKEEAAAVRKREHREYMERQERLRAQSVTEQVWKETEKELETLRESLAGLREALIQQRAALTEEKAGIGRLENGIRLCGENISRQNRRMEDFDRLCSAFARYEEDKKALEALRQKRRRLEEQQKLSGERLERLKEEARTLDSESHLLNRESERLKERLCRYEGCGGPGEEEEKGGDDRRPEEEEEKGGDRQLKEEEEKGGDRQLKEEEEKGGDRRLKEEEGGEGENGVQTEAAGHKDADASPKADSEERIHEMEARFEAITAGFSMEQRELERQSKKSLERFLKAEKALQRLQEKYSLPDGAWEAIRYSREEESHQEALLKEREKTIREKEALWGQEDKHTAVAANEIKDVQSRMERECGQSAALPREEIQSQDFDARIQKLSYLEREKETERAALSERLTCFGEILTALAEYDALPAREEISWDTDIAELSAKGLRDFKGILIRDYHHLLKALQEGRERLTAALNRMIRRDEFQDDFYRKPLESMLELTGEVSLALEQLDTTIASYDSLIEKLEVDISIVEKERDRLVDILEEYVHEVHRHMGRIDKNSTITVRSRPVKMLRLQIPAWEDNAELYHMRMQDLLDEVTHRGVALFEKGENAQEYFGTRITTRNLYDTAIGLGNVQIHLFKIEEHREYPITWAEVSRNSGGEGFLSAFVILSSLLDYMRKDESDIFAEKNEGKVLVMDNPFAQTNASHLLIPLMDMARKTNTQLLCLTGLGGESIYNRFDNIYVIHLIAAGLRNGMQYLRAKRLRGGGGEEMVSARIEVEEALF